MEEKDFKKLIELIKKLAHKCHLAALKGVADLETIRSITTTKEIKYSQQELEHAEKDMKDLEDAIEKHLIAKAQHYEIDILRNIVRSIKNLYLSGFNITIFERIALKDLNNFVNDSVRKIKNEEYRRAINDVISNIIEEWTDNLRTIHEGANAVLSSAKGRTTITLKLTEAIHVRGPSIIKRIQEQHLIKEGHRDTKKANAIMNEIIKTRNLDKNKAFEKLKSLKTTEIEGIKDYTKAIKLLDTDWQNDLKEFNDLVEKTNKAVEKHEIPQRDAEQIKELQTILVNNFVEPFLHSINESVNQLNSIKKQVESKAAQLKKAA
ncbi:hypothetical protein HQ545_02730 [Candidatus Woesearchaeota archaeon]|nr:hypothetical protein [Candidatus Woesearchaeota archaeon]